MRQIVGLKDHIAPGERVTCPEMGAKGAPGKTITRMNLRSRRQRQIDASCQTVERTAGKRAVYRRLTEKRRIDDTARALMFQRLDQRLIPARMHHTEVAKVEIERQLHKPGQGVFPLHQVITILLECFLNNAVVARGMLA